ncbi:uncharacterized protein SCHCODRAFT_02314225 [Schizophyllum commune H4-8]|uniref:uncharacterized protein n=1 Tax=Schizophyllum commune (strain H4-8 / FGSC 9210) TaxID=578458 RepID=UPI00215F33D0|nr:uncharacterized protein SCHCODRAFT_02314225 [Schizophyllum commune H4-8]KAI5891265.1 hypothetical protein SCHCODRAFT_02314225 [Schizophyllum commune H4-8]
MLRLPYAFAYSRFHHACQRSMRIYLYLSFPFTAAYSLSWPYLPFLTAGCLFLHGLPITLGLNPIFLGPLSSFSTSWLWIYGGKSVLKGRARVIIATHVKTCKGCVCRMHLRC